MAWRCNPLVIGELRSRRKEGRPSHPLPDRLRQAGGAVRSARRLVRLHHPVVQYHNQHGPVDPQCPSLRCAVEREVIGERVWDKIAASKRKGLWMGGLAPLGYAGVNKKLTIVETEAETVRLMFRRYLELGSIQALANDLRSQGIRTKQRTGSDGIVGGVLFGTGALAYHAAHKDYTIPINGWIALSLRWLTMRNLPKSKP